MPRKPMESLTESMFYVLLALRQKPMCGIDIADAIEAQTGGRLQIGPATLYTILAKFEKEGYIRETEVEGRKRTYAVTEKGVRAYEAELARLRQCVHDAENPLPDRRCEHEAQQTAHPHPPLAAMPTL